MVLVPTEEAHLFSHKDIHCFSDMSFSVIIQPMSYACLLRPRQFDMLSFCVINGRHDTFKCFVTCHAINVNVRRIIMYDASGWV